MNINKIITVGLCVVAFGIMPAVANAQYDDAVYSGDFDWGSSYDSGYDNSVYSGDFDWGNSYDYSGYDNSVYSGDFDWGNSYDYSGYDNSVYSGDFDWGNSYDYSGYDNSVYSGDFDWGNSYDGSGATYGYDNSVYSGDFTWGTDFNGGAEREYNAGVEREYNVGGVEREYNAGVEREYNPSDCGYYCNEEYVYEPSCGCYQASYGGGYSTGGGFKMPSFGGMTVTPPRYTPPTYNPPTYNPPTYNPPRQNPPTQQPPRQNPPTTTQSTPINIVNTNTNTNTNVNNVSTVSQAIPGYNVQYVYPQTYSYPTYYPTYPTTYTQQPYCTIRIAQGYGNGVISLSWNSGYATSAYISPSVGNVAPNGSTSFAPYGNNVYTMTVYGQGGTATCSTGASNYVANPYVSLTQIPYTGISMGPLANALYWMSLISLAVAGAYLLVYYKGGMLALATTMVARKEKSVTAHAAVQTETKVASLANLPTMQSTTRDAMKIIRSNDGSAPRLVISRS